LEISAANLKSQKDIDAYCSEQFLSCLDRALDTYGGTVKTVVYHALESEYGLPRNDIPKTPEVFVTVLEKFFGMGSKPVERTILRQMETFSGLKNLESYDLATALKKVKHQLHVVANDISEK
jgi:hypothetical protein